MYQLLWNRGSIKVLNKQKAMISVVMAVVAPKLCINVYKKNCIKMKR